MRAQIRSGAELSGERNTDVGLRHPSFFESFTAESVRFDAMNKVSKPFQVLAGAIKIIFKNANGPRCRSRLKSELSQRKIGATPQRNSVSRDLKRADSAAIKRA